MYNYVDIIITITYIRVDAYPKGNLAHARTDYKPSQHRPRPLALFPSGVPRRGGFGCSSSLLIIHCDLQRYWLKQRQGAGLALQRPGSREAARATIAKSVRNRSHNITSGGAFTCALKTATGLALLQMTFLLTSRMLDASD